jgi:subtilisin family serine protease
VRKALLIVGAIAVTAAAVTAGIVLSNRSGDAKRVASRSLAFVRPKTAVARRLVTRKLDVRLGSVAAVARRDGRRSALRQARRTDIDVARRKIRVVVEAAPGSGGQAAKLVRAAGGTVEARSADLVEALVPPAAVTAIAGDPAVRFVRPPLPAEPTAVGGEGVASTHADAWHAAGFTGRGVTVAIIDLGFAGLQKRQESGDLPPQVDARSFCLNGLDNNGQPHGTGVAEIVHEIAPDARLLLLCADSEVRLSDALFYARRQGAAIVSHSVAWFNSSRGDGTGSPGTPDATVAEAARAGILWVNSAGNYGEQHWTGRFTDPDRDGFHNFAGDDETNHASGGCVSLKWDDWPRSSQDFNLYLYRGDELVDSSENVQQGAQAPSEVVCPPDSSSQGYDLKIARAAGAGSPRFDLFARRGSLEHAVGAGSLTEPATSPAALAVAAICWQDDSLESYSSRGPTIDDRTKPDISAPDSISSATYGAFEKCGSSGFTGTSAAAPHVAAIAALVKQRFPSFGPAELRAYLERNAVDLGSAGADNDSGAGKVSLP